MRKIREVLRLKYEKKLSNTKIATSCNISRESVRNYLARAKVAHISWPIAQEMDDLTLEGKLFFRESPDKSVPLPDWKKVHQELKKKGVTLWLLWEEYKAIYPDSFQYARFCELYRAFKATLHPTMRQNHKAGEKLFVDFSGLTVPWIDKKTGEVHHAEIFVAVLGASNYTYVEASADQTLSSWILLNIHALEFLGGVPEIAVPDNLKVGVTKAHYYDPDINATYQEFACHYSIAIVPARAMKPRDKAKVEVGVQGIQRHILAPLRHCTFFSVAEINQAIQPLLKAYNERPFKNLMGSRLSQFEQLDKPVLRLLPAERYVHADWGVTKVGIDYHVGFEKHYYSVPYLYLKKKVSLRITSQTLEVFYNNERIAAHCRAFKPGFTTLKEHMPPAHQAHAEWTPDRLIGWAKKSGPLTAQLIQAVIDDRPFPQQAYRACLGILRLGKAYGEARLENAAKRALTIGAFRYKSIESILKKRLDEQPLPSEIKATLPSDHVNLRGSEYYK